MAGLITGDEFIDTFPACDAAVQGAARASLLQATYVSIYELGCLAGALSALFLGNKLGRRKMIITGSIIMIVGTIIQSELLKGDSRPRPEERLLTFTLSRTVTAVKGYSAGVQFCVGRVITGVGNGMNVSAGLVNSLKPHQLTRHYTRRPPRFLPGSRKLLARTTVVCSSASRPR